MNIDRSTLTLTVGIPAYLHHAGVMRILKVLEDRSDIEILISEDIPSIQEGLKELPDWENISYFQHSPPLGAVPNWNFVLDHARGEFVWLIHHDEVPSFPNGIDTFIGYLNECRADLLFSSLNIENDSFLKRTLRKDSFRLALLRFSHTILIQNFIGSPSNLIVRRERIEEFDENLKWFVDVEWFYRFIKSGIDFELSTFSITSVAYEGSITASLGERISEISLREIDYICSKHRVGMLFRLAWRTKAHVREFCKRRNFND